MQSPNPVEIRSKKSPEKLLLPHPTDLDLDTLRSNEEAVAWLLLGLALSSSAAAAASTARCSLLFLREDDPKHLESFCAADEEKEEEDEILDLSIAFLFKLFDEDDLADE